MRPDEKADLKVIVLLVVGGVLMFFTVKDILRGITLPFIGYRGVRVTESPNEFLLTVTGKIVGALYCFYEGLRLVLKR